MNIYNLWLASQINSHISRKWKPHHQEHEKHFIYLVMYFITLLVSIMLTNLKSRSPLTKIVSIKTKNEHSQNIEADIKFQVIHAGIMSKRDGANLVPSTTTLIFELVANMYLCLYHNNTL